VFSAAEFRDKLDNGRKLAILILEFFDRYGITIVGAVIPSQTTQAQPSAGELAHLIGLIRREHVRAVFPESSLSPRLAQTIAQAGPACIQFIDRAVDGRCGDR